VQSGNAEKHRCGKRKGSALHHQENNADGLKSVHPKRTGDSVNSGYLQKSRRMHLDRQE
jgi:hypothetical protein